MKSQTVLQEDRAYQVLLEWLTTGHVGPGEPVPLREFGRRLGMSRTPLRAAAGRLHEQGLLAYDDKSGFSVAIPSPSDLNELFDARLMIEKHALQRVLADAALAPLDSLHELAELSLSLAPLVPHSSERYREFWKADIRFHRHLIALAGNARLVRFWDQLRLQIHVFQLGQIMPMTEERFQASAAEHAELVAALKARDPERAHALLERHLLRIRDQTIDFAIRAQWRRRPIPEPAWLQEPAQD